MIEAKPTENAQVPLWRHFYIPVSVLVLGILSLAMLGWIDQISQKQRIQFGYANTLDDLRIRVSTAHLWYEEAITYSTEEIDMAWADLRQAMNLAHTLLEGGETEHGLVLPPLADPELRRHALDIQEHLAAFEAIAQERWQVQGKVGSPLDKKMNETFEKLHARAAALDQALEKRRTRDYANSRRMFFGIVLAWSLIVAGSTTELVRREKKRQQAEEALQRSKDELETRVSERTQALGDLNQALNLELHERKKTEQALRESETQLRSLSTRLLTAQETERRRISTELHDELGHALAYMKLQVGLIQKALRTDQAGLRDECGRLSLFVDQVIENVRRLSRELSPAILEDLGLAAALRWLVDTCVGSHETQVVSAVPNIDQLFTRKDQILVYRIVQEALTNVQKHARAKHVVLSIEAEAGRLSFVIEDDGRGFEAEGPGRCAGRLSDKGLGLTTMRERAQMLGGTLQVWSRAGEGTHVTLAVPLQHWQNWRDQ
jgi:signal transduction histidine kinase